MKSIVNKGLLWALIPLALSGAPKLSRAPILPQGQMVALLVDLYLAKALTMSRSADETTAPLIQHVPAIYEAHEVSWEDFHRSMQYYLVHPKELKHIFEAVTQALIALEVQPE
ncbi:MAG: DUF4296 domain-containing protein [Bacteroidota bacterium]